MKKIILTTIATLAISTISVTNFVSANGQDEHKNGEMKMKIMQMQNDFMDRLKKEVDSETAKKLDEMVKNHRAEMKKMMEMAEKNHPTEEQKKQKRMEMKKRHFEDLKNVLKNYPKVYEKYYTEMEEIMAKIMKMRKNMKHNENAKSIREGGRTVGAGQITEILKRTGKPNHNDTNNKTDLKQLAEQLVNLSIKLKNTTNIEERQTLLNKIIVIAQRMKENHSNENMRKRKDKLIINFGGKNMKEDTKAFSEGIVKKGDIILGKIERKFAKYSESKKMTIYKKIIAKLEKVENKIKSEQKRNLIKYIKQGLESKIR